MRSKSISRLALLGLAATALLLAAIACGPETKSECSEEQVFTSQTNSDYQNKEYSRRKKELMESYTPIKGLEFQSEAYQKNWREWRAETELAREVLAKYEDLFWRQPNVWTVSIGFLHDDEGRRTDVVGINIRVTERVCQDDLPPEDRIPERLESIPVRIIEEPDS